VKLLADECKLGRTGMDFGFTLEQTLPLQQTMVFNKQERTLTVSHLSDKVYIIYLLQTHCTPRSL